jgi:hypothetical protein
LEVVGPSIDAHARPIGATLLQNAVLTEEFDRLVAGAPDARLKSAHQPESILETYLRT